MRGNGRRRVQKDECVSGRSARNVRLAIHIEVRDNRFDRASKVDVHFRLKCAVTVPKQEGDVGVATALAHHSVHFAIAIVVGNRYRLPSEPAVSRLVVMGFCTWTCFFVSAHSRIGSRRNSGKVQTST